MKFAKINVSMPQELLKRLDKQANREMKYRSELIREIVQEYLQKNKPAKKS